MLKTISLVWLAAGALLAQQGRGTIQGLITDSSGAAVGGATVTATSTATNQTFRTETTGEGLYLLTNLAVGEYSVAVEKSGFRRSVRPGLTLQVDQRAQVDFKLDVGAVAETVEVKSEALLVDTSNTSIGEVHRGPGDPSGPTRRATTVSKPSVEWRWAATRKAPPVSGATAEVGHSSCHVTMAGSWVKVGSHPSRTAPPLVTRVARLPRSGPSAASPDQSTR